MKVITCPEKYAPQRGEISCFLAGGISNCPDRANDDHNAKDSYIFDLRDQHIFTKYTKPTIKEMKEI